MAESTRTTWTCDRCGCRTSVPQGQEPSFWYRLSESRPPRNDGARVRIGDLCNTCRIEFRTWWQDDAPDRHTVAAEEASG